MSIVLLFRPQYVVPRKNPDKHNQIANKQQKKNTKHFMKKGLFYLLTATTFLVSCSKSADDHVDQAVKEYILDGIYESTFDLQMEIKGTTATVTAFGAYPHDLNKDARVFKVGDAYIKNIHKTGDDEWEGEVVKSNYDMVNNKLTINGYEKTKITAKADKSGIRIENPNKLESSFKKIAESNGGGNGGGTGGGGNGSSDTLYSKQVAGALHEKKTISFNVPVGTKTLTVGTAEFDGSDKNSADMFVRSGSAPVITHTYPPASSSYTYTADCSGIKPNREPELCTFNNPKAGTWYVTLYGYNDYFWSRLIVTITK